MEVLIHLVYVHKELTRLRIQLLSDVLSRVMENIYTAYITWTPYIETFSSYGAIQVD